MKTLANSQYRDEVLYRLAKLTSSVTPRWGKMTAGEMVCHLSDSFRVSLGQKRVASTATWFTRSIYKWAALWSPFPWPHGVQTPRELDQQIGGTPPVQFAADLAELRHLFELFCTSTEEFRAHASFGYLTRRERMRHAYRHMDHHLRQFGV
jgi:hypothetical protein